MKCHKCSSQYEEWDRCYYTQNYGKYFAMALCSLCAYQKDFDHNGYAFRPTSDDWSPNFPSNMVAVSSVIELSNGMFRICVWGADDTGMELDLVSKEKAKDLLRSLPAIITQTDLKSRGFKWA